MIDKDETLSQIQRFLFKEYRDGEGNRVWCTELEDGYFYLWADGNTHHSYHRPEKMGYDLVV